MKLATFDIIDTCLLRDCGIPEVVFNLLSFKKFPNNESNREDFFRFREKAKGHSLKDIYNQIVNRSKLVEYNISDLELEVEASVLKLNPNVLDIIKHLRKDGYEIKFISKTYLPSQFLKKNFKKRRSFRK